MTFKAIVPDDRWIPVSLACATFIIAVTFTFLIPLQSVTNRLYWLIVGAGGFWGLSVYFVYHLIALFGLRYALSRNGLTIYFGATTYYIPIRDIYSIKPASQSSLTQRSILPAWIVGRRGRAYFFATAGLQDSLVVQTRRYSWILSPQNPQDFIQAYQHRVSLGPSQFWTFTVQRWSIFGWSVWQDPLAHFLAGGAFVIWVFFIRTTLTYIPDWPDSLLFSPILLNPAIVDPHSIHPLWFPILGAVVLGFNLFLGGLLYWRERVLAYLIWSVAIAIQIIFWIALQMTI